MEELVDIRALATEFRTADSSISVFNHPTGVIISFEKARYFESPDGVYRTQINIPATENDYVEVFRRVVGILKKCIREKSTGLEVYSQLVINLYNSRLVDSNVFKVFEG